MGQWVNFYERRSLETCRGSSDTLDEKRHWFGSEWGQCRRTNMEEFKVHLEVKHWKCGNGWAEGDKNMWLWLDVEGLGKRQRFVKFKIGIPVTFSTSEIKYLVCVQSKISKKTVRCTCVRFLSKGSRMFQGGILQLWKIRKESFQNKKGLCNLECCDPQWCKYGNLCSVRLENICKSLNPDQIIKDKHINLLLTKTENRKVVPRWASPGRWEYEDEVEEHSLHIFHSIFDSLRLSPPPRPPARGGTEDKLKTIGHSPAPTSFQACFRFSSSAFNFLIASTWWFLNRTGFRNQCSQHRQSTTRHESCTIPISSALVQVTARSMCCLPSLLPITPPPPQSTMGHPQCNGAGQPNEGG